MNATSPLPFSFGLRSLVTRLFLSLMLTLPHAVSAASPGDVDPAFDPGRGPSNVGAGTGRGVLIQPDGKILTGGMFNAVNLTETGPIVRFLPDGAIDRSFDTSPLRPSRFSLSGQTDLVPLALQPNGQILIAPGSSMGATVHVHCCACILTAG
jgi:hypothetical protein